MNSDFRILSADQKNLIEDLVEHIIANSSSGKHLVVLESKTNDLQELTQFIKLIFGERKEYTECIQYSYI